METAARLLRRSDLNIQQIIAQVGYENTSYFYRLFHERYGLSPREYRMVRTGTAPPPPQRMNHPLFCCPRPPCCRPAHGGLSLPQNGEKSGALWKIVLY